jgi:hypothetical protein
MAKVKTSQHAEILEYALSHLEKERDDIQARIDHIRRELGGRASSASSRPSAPAAPAAAAAAPRKKRVLSEAARKRIAAAQKRRWAAHRKAQKAE